MERVLIYMFILAVYFTSSRAYDVLPLRKSANMLSPRRQLSCYCDEGICKCCVTIKTPMLSMEQRGCLEATIIKEEAAVLMNFTLNGSSLWHNKLSGRNPPPLCIAIPQFPFIRLCLVLKDIYFEAGSLHVCPDVDVRLPINITLLVITFECLNVGTDGVTFLKPNLSNSTTANGA